MLISGSKGKGSTEIRDWLRAELVKSHVNQKVHFAETIPDPSVLVIVVEPNATSGDE